MFWDFGLIDLVWEWFRWFLSIPHPQKDQVQPWFHGKRAGWWLEPWNPWALTVGSWVPPTGTAKLGVRASSITFEDELLSKNFQVVKCAAFREELESGLKPTNFHQIDIEKV